MAGQADSYIGQSGVDAPAKRFVAITAGNGADTDLAELPKFVIVNITTAGGSVALKDADGNSSTLTLPLGAWVLPLRPRRVVTVTNATVVCCY